MALKYRFNLKDIKLADFKVYLLALFKLPPAVQDDPSYSSVALNPAGGLPLPPKAKAEVKVPAPPNAILEVDKLPPLDQADPSYSKLDVDPLAVDVPPPAES